MPYLRIFTGEGGIQEIVLPRGRVLIGRPGGDAAVVLDHPTVSRKHALIIELNGAHYVEDAKSRFGTYLNCTRLEAPAKLAHGDAIQLGECIVEFRSDDVKRQQTTAMIRDLAGPIRKMKLIYRRLPESLRVRFRVLALMPDDVFVEGDTRLVGDGGVLLPVLEPAPENTVIELQITSPNGSTKTFPGEVMAVLPDDSPPSMCLKLHEPDSRGIYHKFLIDCGRGSWVLAQPGRKPM